MKVDKFRLLFFGSDPFSIRVLSYLLDRKVCHIEVIAKPHTLLDKYSSSRQLIRYAWPHGLTNVPNAAHNIGLVASFGSLIDETTIKRFRYGLFNVHPSLLPKYRGSTPIQTAVFEGVQETGCTIMQIPPIPKFDIGSIVLQEKIAIKQGEYAIELRDRLAHLGAQMAERLLLDYETCMQHVTPQDSSHKSLARKLRPEQGHLRFRDESLDLIERKVRAYSGFIDLYISCFGGLKVKLEAMEESREVDRYELDKLVSSLNGANRDRNTSVIPKPNELMIAASPGAMFFHKLRRRLCLKTADHKWAAFGWVTPEQKPKMSALDFYNGYLSKLPQQLRLCDT